MRRRAHLLAALLLIMTAFGVVAQEDAKFRSSGANAGMSGRYRVSIAHQLGDEVETISRELAATYGGRLEPYAEMGSVGFAIVVSETRARMLSRDPRVVTVEEMESSALVAQPPSVRVERVMAESAGPPMRIATEAISGFGTYTYDGSGNITSIGEGASKDSFVYDRLGRLQSATLRDGPGQTFTYDPYGNILTVVTAGDSVTKKLGVDKTTNQIDQPFDDNGQPNNVVGTYDLRGNLTSYNSGTFVYDGLDRMTESTVDGVHRVYIYSASDERILTIKTVGSSVVGDWTIRDPGGRVLRRFTDTNGTFAWTEDYIYRGGELLATAVPGPEKIRHFHLDHLGTPRLVTGNGGAQVAQHHYQPFGPELPSSTNDGEKKKFTGHERDAATLDYMHARYYDPFMGRFLSVDPGGFDPTRPQSWNRYSYVTNNPMNLTDPTGKCGESADFIGPTTPCDMGFMMEVAVTAEGPGFFEHVNFIAGETTAQLTPFGPLPGTPEGLWAAYQEQQFLNANPDWRPGILNGVVVLGGDFSITNWQGYPSNVAQPSGPFRVLQGEEYATARTAANNANRALHRADSALAGQQMHEIQPVKLNGSPTNPANKVPLSSAQHQAVSSWWSRFLRDLLNP